MKVERFISIIVKIKGSNSGKVICNHVGIDSLFMLTSNSVILSGVEGFVIQKKRETDPSAPVGRSG
jgi:hypothetical protein